MSKLWTKQPKKPAAIALMSGLKIYSSQWQWVDKPVDADLWCVNVDADDVDVLAQLYRQARSPKPKVIYLAGSFTPMPISHWVYFKTPLNVRVLHKWLAANDFPAANTSQPDTSADETSLQSTPKWKTHNFKLTYWPNVTQYAGGAEIMMACSLMMHDWCEYNQLIPFNIDDKTLTKLLIDADNEGNLKYYSKPALVGEQTERNNNNEPEAKGWGIFKKIFNRFS